MKKVKRHVERCNQCQRMKNRAEMLAGKLRPNTVLERLATYISGLCYKVTSIKDLILVLCDKFLKMSYFIVMTEKTTAEGLTKLFKNNIWKLHGLSKSMISDRGPQFTVGLIKELNEMLGIETKLPIAFHP